MRSSNLILIDQLRIQLENPKTAAKVRENMTTRLFSDLPEEFDYVLSDSAGDVIDLIQILKNIPQSHAINPDNSGQKPNFKLSSDAIMIELWAKGILSRVCRELLDEKNGIKRELQDILNKIPKIVSSHDLISSYFSNASQYYIKAVVNSREIDSINEDVFKAFIEYINNYVDWVNDVFKDRLTDPNKSYVAAQSGLLTILNDMNLAVGVGTGLLVFGLFGAAAFLTYRAYKSSEDKNTDDSHSPSVKRN